MKIVELFDVEVKEPYAEELLGEMPYNPKGENHPNYWEQTIDVFHSFRTLDREYSMLGKINLKIDNKLVELNFIQHKEYHDIKAGYVDFNPLSHENAFKIIFILEFRKQVQLNAVPKELNKRKLLQVRQIITSERLRGNGIGLLGYQYALKQGFNVLSDSTQFDGDKALWQKMARLSQIKDYSIVILDSNRGYMKRNNKVIEYDGTNIHDDDIWTYGEDYSGEDILLLMRIKQ